MTVILHSTTKVVDLVVDGKVVPARIWEGRTSHGIECHAFITRIAARDDADLKEFESDLLSQAKPTPEIEAIPLRLII